MDSGEWANVVPIIDGDSNICGETENVEDKPYLYITDLNNEKFEKKLESAVCVSICPTTNK